LHLLNSNFFAASKFSITSGAGVIDADYRGVVFVLLFNLADKDFEGEDTAFAYLKHNTDARSAVQEGDRIAQLILEKIHTPEVLEVNVSLITLLV
jgi:dUTP pyrophosphatase